MAGGLINIASYGSGDLYLTGAPQITFFKLVYRRHTNFSIESVYIDVENELAFGEESEVIIPPLGDAIHKGYLEVIIPEVAIKKSDIGIPLTQISTTELNTKLDNYNKIIKFMSLNTAAYRAAYENIRTLNVSALTIIDSALEQFQDAPIEGSTGIETIKSTIINNYSTLVSGTPEVSSLENNLFLILDDIRNAIVGGSSVTKNDIMTIIDNAINNSVKIQHYFFTDILAYKDRIADQTSENIKFAWVDKLGHSMIDYIDVYIGGERIDRHYGQWIDIWYELTGNREQEEMYFKMIGNVPEMTTFNRISKPEYKLYIPLNFWFNRHNGLALPLIALQYSDVAINIKLAPLSKCCYIERILDTNGSEVFVSLDDIWDDNNYKLSARILMDYVFMEHTERKKFAQSSHEYLIETVQCLKFKDILQTNVSIKLDFRHPCKELVWIAQKTALTKDTSPYTKSHSTIYSVDSSGENNPFLESSMNLNNQTRLDKFDGNYFNYYQTLKHRNTPADGINSYSFGLHPEELQPSGTCNFSRIPGVVMFFTLDSNLFTYNLSEVRPDVISGSADDTVLDTDVMIYVFAISYNILRIIGGFGGIAFS
jgi:hypothetical protein